MTHESLLPYQARWASDRSILKIMIHSRLVGATWTTAFEAVTVASATTESGGMDVYYWGGAEAFIEECAEWAERLGVVGEIFHEEDEGVEEHRIEFDSFEIRAVGGDSLPASPRGKMGYTILDNAAFQDARAWLKACAGTLVWGGRVALLSSHNGQSAFLEITKDVRSGAKKGSLHEVTIHDALADGLFEKMSSERAKRGAPALGSSDEWLGDLRAQLGDRFTEEFECVPRMSSPKTSLPRLLCAFEFEGKSYRLIRNKHGGAVAEELEGTDALGAERWGAIELIAEDQAGPVEDIPGFAAVAVEAATGRPLSDPEPPRRADVDDVDLEHLEAVTRNSLAARCGLIDGDMKGGASWDELRGLFARRGSGFRDRQGSLDSLRKLIGEAPPPRTYAIDYDGTWTTDPDLFESLAAKMRERGHRVLLVTARATGHAEVTEAAGRHVDRVIFTPGTPKRVKCRRAPGWAEAGR